MSDRTSTAPAAPAVVPCPFCRRLNRVDLERAADRPRCGDCGRPILLDRPIAVTDDDFDQVVGGASVPVLVDFHAVWCGPCLMMAPMLDELAADRAGELLVAKLDVDRNPATAGRLGVRSMPTLVAFRDGREAARRVGAIGRSGIEALVAEAAGATSRDRPGGGDAEPPDPGA